MAKPEVSIAYDKNGPIRLPEVNVKPLPGDELVPLRGFGYVVAIRRQGEIIGWAKKQDCPSPKQ